MPIHKSTFFPESALAHELLDGLTGLEVGGAMHNAFGLDTINVDRVPTDHPDFAPYAAEQIRIGNMGTGGAVMPVDIVAPGDCIPVADQSFDFVISSHVIEHFYDPISAIKEWMRISRQYIFIICPQRDALESDKDKPLTGLDEHVERFSQPDKFSTDEHHSRWTPESFCDMVMWICNTPFGRGWDLYKWLAVDDKAGNGMTIVLRKTGA